MDYSLGALKLLCVHLKHARKSSSSHASTLGGILFQRAWLQGVLVSTPPSSNSVGGGVRYFHLDDGTGVVELLVSDRSLKWEKGMYVMVVGVYYVRDNNTSVVKVHKMVDLSPFPDRESTWYLEVMDVFKLFYQHMFLDSAGARE